jgi:hypothetical protein
MFREVVGRLDLVSPMSQCNGGRGPILFDRGFRTPFFIFMSPCGGMMLMPVGRPVYLCKLLHHNSPRAVPTGL